MAEEPQQLDDPWSPQASRAARLRVGGVAIVLLVLAAVAAFVSFRFIDGEREREMTSWQSRLRLVAASRSDAVESWYAAQQREMAGIADSTSTRLYLMQIVENKPEDRERTPEAEYLRNLLTVTADRAGFKAPLPGPNVPANVGRVGVAGIAIIDASGRPIVATQNMPPMTADVMRFIANAEKAKPAVLDIFLGSDGHPAMGFLAPVFSVQGERVAADQIAWVFGIKPIGNELYPLLKQPGIDEKTAEAVLVRKAGAVVEYLSPLKDGSPALKQKLALNTPMLDATTLTAVPDSFGVFRDYAGNQVLATARAIAGSPWTLIYKIDRSEALADSDARLSRMLIILLLATALLLLFAFALWRHGASRRASVSAAQYKNAATRLEHQRNFLRVLTDNQPNAIYIVDEADTVRFANEPAARRIGLAAPDLAGKTLAALFGPVLARRMERLNRLALETNKPLSDIHREDTGTAVAIKQSRHVPLSASAEMPKSVLVVEEDITTAVTERERREENLRRLVDALLTVVDRRDPNAADHSKRVADLARAVAGEMGLAENLIETASFAGSLLNLGKIMVPEAILTKPDKLTAEELEQVRKAVGAGADLIEGIDFGGPVAETLRQAQERWNGTGTPKGLKGDAILPTARVVAVANAFVAMVSTRAHRAGLPIDQALAVLMGEAGQAYDRAVVGALINYLDNKGGRKNWM
ncbi:MAG: HD domain-containing phosphohydrolase [Alphaproteobacteria bacterium]